MSAALLIARRELGSYLRTWSGYLVVAGCLALNALMFHAFAMGSGSKRSAEVISDFFYYSSGMTMTAAILLSMRLLAEERQSGTLALLYSSPLRDHEIVLGKYLSGMAFLAIYILSTVYLPLMVIVNGKISVGHLAAGYLGLMLIGSAAMAIGTFGSALTKSQVVAAVTSAVLLVTMLVAWLLAHVTERPLSTIFPAMALHGMHFSPFQKGVIHVRDIVYYGLVTYVALFASTRVLEARRWK